MGNVPPGTYSIGSGDFFGDWVLGERTDVVSGTEVLLKLVRAGTVELTVTGADTQDVWVWHAKVEAGSSGPEGNGPYDLENGRFNRTLKGLQPGTHWISAHNESGTRLGVAWPVHVVPGPEVTTCLIELEPALEVELVNHDATRAARARPNFGLFLTVGGYAAAGERSVFAVPSGTSDVLVRLGGDEWVRHTVSGAAGTRVTIEVGTPASVDPGD